MKRSKKKMLARDNEHPMSFKESVLIGQFEAKLRRKEITSDKIPIWYRNIIEAGMLRNAKKTMQQAEKFLAQHGGNEHVHGADCKHETSLTSEEETILDDAGFGLDTEPIANPHVCDDDCDHGDSI